MEAHKSVWPHCIVFAEKNSCQRRIFWEKEIKSATRWPAIFPKKNSLEARLTVFSMKKKKKKKSLAVELCCFSKLTYETSQFPAATSLSHWYDIFSKTLLWKPGSSATISLSKSLRRLTDWSSSLNTSHPIGTFNFWWPRSSSSIFNPLSQSPSKTMFSH